MNYNTYEMPAFSISHKSVLNTGFLLAMVGIVFALAPSLANTVENKGLGIAINMISLFITVIIYFITLKKYRDEELGGYMTFGRGFQFVFFASIIVAIVTSIFVFIQMKYIDPSMMDEAMNQQMAEMEKQGMTEEQMEMASQMTGIFKTPMAIAIISLLAQLFWGAILGLIFGAIMKKCPPPVQHSTQVYKDLNEETSI